MNVKELINCLEDRTGMRPLKFSDEGVISFIFNDNFTCNIEKSEEDKLITIYGSLGNLPIENREECMKSLLDANLFGYKTFGATIGVDQDTEEIFLCKSFDLMNLQFDLFYEELTEFLKTQKNWTNKITDQAYLS